MFIKLKNLFYLYINIKIQNNILIILFKKLKN